MFSLTLAVGTHSWRLLFQDKEKAKGVFDALQHPSHVDGSYIGDDFGQEVYITRGGLIGFCLEDLDESKLGMVELALHQARTQNAAQAAAQTDPALRHARQGQGPAIISPMGNGFRPS